MLRLNVAILLLSSCQLASTFHAHTLLLSTPAAATAAVKLPRKQRLQQLQPQRAHSHAAVSRRTPAHMVLRGGFSFGSLIASIVLMAESVPALMILGISIGLEVLATTSMKLAAITGSKAYFAGVYVCYGLCFSIFPLALKRLPLSLAYATWSGVGTAASVLIGAAYFGEKVTLLKLMWIGLIILGVVGLNA